jgi:hypothetical protein
MPERNARNVRLDHAGIDLEIAIAAAVERSLAFLRSNPDRVAGRGKAELPKVVLAKPAAIRERILAVTLEAMPAVMTGRMTGPGERFRHCPESP